MKFPKARKRRGSSLVYLGISLIVFAISFGLMFLLVPMILGAFFTLIPPPMTSSWLAIYNHNIQTIQFLIQLIPSLGIFFLVLKILMIASNRGRD